MMKFKIITRNKTKHIGLSTYVGGIQYIISPCNGTWYLKDTVSVGEKQEITCKKCFKLAEEAENNNGRVDLRRRK